MTAGNILQYPTAIEINHIPSEFQVLTAASMKQAAFWDIAPRNLVEVYRRFRGASQTVSTYKTSVYFYKTAQSVQCLTTDWTTERSRFDSQQRKEDFSSILCVQTGSGAHPASCTVGTGGPFPGGKARPRRDADCSPHLVARSRVGATPHLRPTPPCRAVGLIYVLLLQDHTAVCPKRLSLNVRAQSNQECPRR
jgi:hypothetical protein